MNKRSTLLTSLILVLSFVLSACIGLIPLEEEPTTGNFGPSASLQEQQAKTFETLWKDFEDNYIYFETADVNWDALHDKYLQRIKPGLTSEQFTSLIRDLETELPSRSLLYESRAARIERDTVDTSSYEGIGAFVGFAEEPTPHIILLSVIEGSPAQKAGLKAHDSILKIDGDPIPSKEGITAVDRVRGPAGSTVTLSIQSPGEAEHSVEIKRSKLTSVEKLEASTIQGTNYGYLLFPPIGYDALTEDVKQGLQTLTTDKKLDGLVIDLRVANSSSGWPLEAVDTMFDTGTLGELYNRNNKQLIEVKGENVFSSQKVPLVILVGKNTIGFPEILAAGLQSHKRAILIGETTPGAIEAMSTFYLPDGAQAFIESTSFTLSNGDQIGTTGVIPDVPVEASWDEVAPDHDPVLDQAIETLDGQK